MAGETFRVLSGRRALPGQAQGGEDVGMAWQGLQEAVGVPSLTRLGVRFEFFLRSSAVILLLAFVSLQACLCRCAQKLTP